jgi:hypothetical protein
VTFTVVPQSVLFAGASDDAAGPFVAPFHFSLVGAGHYLLEGFVDQDGCASGASDCIVPDFNPFFTVTREPNAGDVGGAALAADGSLQVFTIAKGSNGQLNAVTGASVGFADSARFPADRPVFSVSGSGTLDPAGGPIALTLTATPIDLGPVHERSPVFLAKYVDEDGDGQPDDANGDGAPDFFPKVFVRKLADEGPPLADENDLDQNGVLDATGVDYEHVDGTKDGKPDAVVLAAAIDPAPIIAALGGGSPDVNAVAPLTSLTVYVKPLALDASDPTQPVPLKDVPKGRYAITIENFTGQTWRTPNELDPALAPAFQMQGAVTQSFVIEVP